MRRDQCGQNRTLTYDLAGRKLTETDARGNVTLFGYDAAGRMTSVRDGALNVTTYGYDAKGQRTSMLDAKGRTTSYTYDSRGRQLVTTLPGGVTTSKAYDGLGLVISSTDEESRVTQYGYDAASQLTSVTDALNQITRYAYDLSGNKVSQTDANNRVTTYVYDKLNRRTSRTLPLSQVETMNYDFVGNLTSKVDFNGKTTSYAYDSLNRLLSKTPDASFSGAAAIVMTYTSTGQRASMTDASGASSFTYDSRDRLKTKVTPQGTLTYTYDGASNVTRVVSSNANGTDVNYTFDANNRLATVVDNRTAGTTTYSYDATNQLSGFAYPNGVGHVHTYDNRDRLTNVAVNGPSGVLANYGQTFSPSSHKTAVNENSGRAVNYSYDSIYRLLNESITGNANSALNGALAYGLDPVGNRLSLTSTLAGIAAQTNTFDSNDRLVADTYDANGNTLASGGNTFGYEFEDRLTSYNAGAITYLYDGDGNRVARTEAGSTTRFLIDDLTPTGYAQVAEEVVAGFVVRQYTHGLMRVSQRQNIGGTWTTSYYGYDGFGSTRQLLDGAGVVTDTFAFDGFGNLVVRTGTTPNQYLYRGEALDAGTGMYYLRARWYRPGVGLFATQDTYEGNERQPKTLQLYAFPETDPINLVDPSGHGGRIISLGLILANITIHNAAKIEQVGLFTRGQLSLGVSSIVRASYFQQLMANADPVAGRMRVVASGVFIDRGGKIINATAVTFNRATPAIKAAIKEMEGAGDELLIKFPLPPGYDKVNNHLHHAEILLYNWARNAGNSVASIAAGNVAGNCGMCAEFFRNASAKQLAEEGFPIFFR